MKMLGKIGLLAGGIGAFCLCAAVAGWLFAGTGFLTNPFLIFSLIATSISVQLLALGLIGEVCTRIYYSAQDKKSYQVRDLVNFETKASSEKSDDDRPQYPRIAA